MLLCTYVVCCYAPMWYVIMHNIVCRYALMLLCNYMECCYAPMWYVIMHNIVCYYAPVWYVYMLFLQAPPIRHII